MIHINKHYKDLEASYLFTDIARKVSAYAKANPDKDILRLGIGDVTRPLPQVAIDAMKKAADDLGTVEQFHGYGPEQGYPWLRDAIAANDYHKRGLEHILAKDIFVSDGAKSDTGNFLDILGEDIVVAVADPVYPVYVDTNIMAGRKTKIHRLPATKENDYLPAPSKDDPIFDLIYICSPNNPTGSIATKEFLQSWVDYALEHQSLILFDAAYEAFVGEGHIRSIYEIEGAEKCAVEIKSFSKSAGFTGVRCGYTVVPEALLVKDLAGNEHSLSALWSRRQTTKFNGVSYPVQRAAEALFTEEGQAQCKALVDYYKRNANLLLTSLKEIGLDVSGGEHAPYVWLKVPEGHTSWSYFDYLLETINIVTTPGSGFGDCGEGYIRLSAFGSYENCMEAVSRIKGLGEQ